MTEAAAKKTINILLIEDDCDDIELMSSTITVSNRRNTTQLHLTSFTSIADAFSDFQVGKYDLILLDLNLGATMGVETLKEVEQQQQHQLPIIVLTGLSSSHVGLECIRHGASDYLIKRKIYTNQLVSNQFLLKPIQYAVERHKLSKQIYHQKQHIEDSYQELQQLAFHASHDLKEPITTIVRFLQLFQTKYANQLSLEAQETLRFMFDQANLQHKHIEALLEYLTIEQEHAPIQQINMHQLLAKLLATWKEEHAEATDVQIQYQTIAQLNTNPVYLNLILTELLNNALQFRNPSIPLQITIEVKEQKANTPRKNYLITIQDNGQGLSMEYNQHIFEMFKTLQPKSQSNSVGAGLALVRKMLKQLKGKIWVESALGTGSTFFVELPKLDTD